MSNGRPAIRQSLMSEPLSTVVRAAQPSITRRENFPPHLIPTQATEDMVKKPERKVKTASTQTEEPLAVVLSNQVDRRFTELKDMVQQIHEGVICISEVQRYMLKEMESARSKHQSMLEEMESARSKQQTAVYTWTSSARSELW